ncbi:MAG: hypothetical protein R2942_11765 [Ignavibacteria bacterium]
MSKSREQMSVNQKANIRRFFSSKLYLCRYLSALFKFNNILRRQQFTCHKYHPCKINRSGITGTVTVIIITTYKPVIFISSFNEAILSFDGVITGATARVPP